MLMQITTFVKAHAVEILAFLLALSEALALIPGIKSNSIFQAIYNGLKKLKDMLPKSEDKSGA